MNINYLETIFKISAIIAAAGFFGWKIIAGWLIINLEISIETTRQSKDEVHDWLAIDLLLKKGNTDGLWLKDVVVRIYNKGGKPVNQVIRIEDFMSVAVKHKQIDWDAKNKDIRKYTLAPGEVFQYGRVVEVPTNTPLIIEAAVLGRRTLWYKDFQWRATAASLPIKKNN